MSLFRLGKFTSAAGIDLLWKIECNALTEEDWNCIATIVRPWLPPYGDVVGVPRGGIILASYFRPYVTQGSRHLLVVDDVWTTGKSMVQCAKDSLSIAGQLNLNRYDDWHGFVAFARGQLPASGRVRTFLQANF